MLYIVYFYLQNITDHVGHVLKKMNVLTYSYLILREFVSRWVGLEFVENLPSPAVILSFSDAL